MVTFQNISSIVTRLTGKYRVVIPEERPSCDGAEAYVNCNSPLTLMLSHVDLLMETVNEGH